MKHGLQARKRTGGKDTVCTVKSGRIKRGGANGVKKNYFEE